MNLEFYIKEKKIPITELELELVKKTVDHIERNKTDYSIDDIFYAIGYIFINEQRDDTSNRNTEFENIKKITLKDIEGLTEFIYSKLKFNVKV